MIKRRVVCAANLCISSGAIILGARHWDKCMVNHHNLFEIAEVDTSFDDQGFIDQHGVFMSRQEAWEVAEKAGQIVRRVGGDDADGGTLYSENLY